MSRKFEPADGATKTITVTLDVEVSYSKGDDYRSGYRGGWGVTRTWQQLGMAAATKAEEGAADEWQGECDDAEEARGDEEFETFEAREAERLASDFPEDRDDS